MQDEREFSEGGSEIFRHEAPQEPAPIDMDTPNLELVQDHVETHLGPVDGVYHEILSPYVHIDVLQVAPSEERPWCTLVTCGASSLPMAVPEELDAPRFLELLLSLPPDWRLTQEDFQDERWYWPVRLLKTLARLPHEYGTWLGIGHTVPNGDPPEPYAPGTALCGAIVLPALLPPDEFAVLELPQGDIHFLAAVPLHAAEMDLKLRRGTEGLADAWDDAGMPVTELVDPQRPGLPFRRKRRFGLF